MKLDVLHPLFDFIITDTEVNQSNAA